MDFYLVLYFLAGIVQDFLTTLNWRFIAKENMPLAVLPSFLSTVVWFLVLYNILTRLDGERSLLAIIVYAAGIGIGTFFGMKLKISFKDSKKL